MQVHCDEGVAIHIGPEPCVAVCEGARLRRLAPTPSPTGLLERDSVEDWIGRERLGSVAWRLSCTDSTCRP